MNTVEVYEQTTVEIEANIEVNENIAKKQIRMKKYPSPCMNIRHYFSEYSGLTNVHGFKYLGEQNRSIVERIWWIAVFVMSFWICLLLIKRIYHKWETSPVIITFASYPTSVSAIPFPAVTICSESKVRPKEYNFTHFLVKMIYNGNNMTDEELKTLGDVSLLCGGDAIKHILQGDESINLSTIEFYRKIATRIGDLMDSCEWNEDGIIGCDNYFTEVLTEDGICYTFNMLDREEIYTKRVFHNGNFLNHTIDSNGWTIENGYSKDEDIYPRRTMLAGAKSGLVVYLNSLKEDFDIFCSDFIYGFKIILHNPMEVPRPNTQFIRASFDKEITVTIKPEMIITSPSLLSYSPYRRQCFFNSERSLYYYRIYTKQNCEVECLSNFTYEQCGCVAYHMPRNESMLICGPGKADCITLAERELMSRQSQPNKDPQTVLNACDCLPDCTTISYNADISQSELNWRDAFRLLGENVSNYKRFQEKSRLTLFFKQTEFISTQRDELYGAADFLSNCIGLLDLFVGFSLVSFIEIIYFLTLRLMCNFKKYGRYHWSGLRRVQHKIQ